MDFSFVAFGSSLFYSTFFENVLFKAVIAQIFPPGVRDWSASVSWREIEVFDPQA